MILKITLSPNFSKSNSFFPFFSSFDQLNTDLMIKIFGEFSFPELVKLSLVSKKWCEISRHPLLALNFYKQFIEKLLPVLQRSIYTYKNTTVQTQNTKKWICIYQVTIYDSLKIEKPSLHFLEQFFVTENWKRFDANCSKHFLMKIKRHSHSSLKNNHKKIFKNIENSINQMISTINI